MALFRWALAGTAAYSFYKFITRPRAIARGTQAHDGLAAVFRTREQVDLAIEHLVQEYGVSRSAIFVEPVDEENTSGTSVSGGDAPSGDAGSRARSDAALNGAIRVTVGTTENEPARLRRALNDAGAVEVRTL